jgi:hypothetical protein
MRTSTLVEDMPKFEIRDGLLHVIGNITEYALPLALVRRAIPAIAAAIAQFDARPDNVIPLCDLCVRHNLPRLGSAH